MTKICSSMGRWKGSDASARRAMDIVEVDGLHIAYERAGSGPSLVLLHGYVGDGPTTWRRQIEALCDDFTVVAWDAPRVGRSSDPPERLVASQFPGEIARA